MNFSTPARPKARLEECYGSYVAGILRTLRFDTGEAHGCAEMMGFNYLMENRALIHSGGRYAIVYARIPAALSQLARELLVMEGKRLTNPGEIIGALRTSGLG
jgi:hypothetical protein